MRFIRKLRKSALVLILLALLGFLFGLYSRREGRASLIDEVRFIALAFLPQKNLTMQEGQKWYSENKNALMELHKVVLQNPKILRVEPALSIRYIPNSEIFTPEDMTIYNELKQKCVSLGIKHIAIEREGGDSKGSLFLVRYTLSSSGLSVSGGRLLSVSFVPDKLAVSRIYDTPEYVVTPLDEENWYLVDYRDGRK